MIKVFLSAAVVILPLVVSGCDLGPYTPSTHHHADTSTGSMLSGTDTSANLNDNINRDNDVGSNHAVFNH